MRHVAFGPTVRRLPALALAALVLLLCAGLSAGDEGATVEDRLNQAKDLERMQGDPEGALAIYEALARAKDLAGAIKGEVLAGAARCHKRVGSLAMAARYWDQIIADQSLDAKLIAWARQELVEKAAAEEGSGGSDDAERRERARLRAEQRRRAQEGLAAARKALEARRFDEAMHLCLLARTLDPDNPSAQRLLEEIESQRPDLGNVLGRLIEFVQTKELEEFEWLRTEVDNIGRAAKRAFDIQEWREADRLYRMAIGLIDDSGFLTLGATVDTGSLGEVRARLLQFLREAHDRGRRAGLSFEPEPEMPDLEARKGSGARALFGTLADMFTPREEGAESLHFFEFAPTLKRRGGRPLPPLVTSAFPGLKAEHTAGTLTRARWAERWIRRNIGARWMSTAKLARRGLEDGRARKRRRLLIRVGDLICAQHGDAEHGRIEALQRSFDATPPPIRVDIRLYAANARGAVRAAEALRARARASGSGLDHVVTSTLLAESVTALQKLAGDVNPLGHAQLKLDGVTSVLMEVTGFTAEHPLYRKVPEPALTIEDRDARYGLWLDLYAEDLPGRTGPGNDRSALSVRARVTQPHPLTPSHVVPRASRANPAWTRLPILVERVIEADREVPHYGTFVLQGLPNPFPATNEAHGELIVLIGTTRQDTPTPDPPRAKDEPAIVPADLLSREYRLGPLSTEVEDQVVPEGWPVLRTAAEGMSAADRRRQRDLNLANILMSLAGIDADAPGAADAVTVQDHLVTGTMSSGDHIRLQQAVQRLRARESDLYEVTVMSAAVADGVWKRWRELEGMTRNARGNWRVRGAARTTIEKAMATLVERGGLFDTRLSLPARATQQVLHAPLRSQTITKDLRRLLSSHGREQFTPIFGVAEEGLLVEVRPNVEFEQDGASLRGVRVRARAARLKSIEKHAYPRTKQAAALYDVPIWYPGSMRTHSEASDGEILDNDTLLLLPLLYPGDQARVIVVAVGVRKTQ